MPQKGYTYVNLLMMYKVTEGVLLFRVMANFSKFLFLFENQVTSMQN